jgi:DNA-binding winged helix-turn-helix (wHTH) protein
MSGQEPQIYEFDEFRLNIGEGVLLREGNPVCLQRKTFETLCALVKSNGRLVATAELMEALWTDTFVEENNLRQHISALRKSLGEKEKQTLFIETVPRRGYRFLPPIRVVDSNETTIHPPHNLPVQFAELIGREKEIAEILNLLRREDVRILTLTGVGGTGKTTLARAVAREVFVDFPDGAFFIELAAVTNPELVASTIAQTLGVKETGGKPVREVLTDYLREKQMLLVADNFEQLVAPLDRPADRLLAARQIPRAAGQKPQTVRQFFENRVRRNYPHARRRQLDRERQTVEPPADFGDAFGIFFRR